MEYVVVIQCVMEKETQMEMVIVKELQYLYLTVGKLLLLEEII